MRTVDRKAKKLVIITAAIDAFAENGYEKTTVSDIAKNANIATGGVYNYFSGKDRLFELCCAHIYELFLSGLEEDARSGEGIFQTVYYSIRFFRNNPAYAKLLLIEAKDFFIRFPQSGELAFWLDKTAGHIQQRLAQVFPAMGQGGDTAFYVTVLLGAVESIIVLWLFRPESINMSEKAVALKLSRIIRKTADFRE